MATNTYVALRTETVAVATSSVTISLTGISGYTDLVLVANYSKSAGARLNLTYNGDTGNNYSYTRMNGNGSAASSDRIANFGIIDAGYTDTTRATSIIHIMNYSNTTTFKTTLIRANSTAEGTGAFSALWRNTAAITSITLGGLNNIQAGSTFSLYGIAAASIDAKATGGIIYSGNNYYYHVFNSSGIFTPLTNITNAEYLVIAGGGAGGVNQGAGGGAGGYRSSVVGEPSGGGASAESRVNFTNGTNYTITVGAGGVGGYNSTPQAGANGNASSIAGSGFTTISTVGGGGGGAALSINGQSGGSGGGAGGSGSNTPGSNTANQGYPGNQYGGGGAGGSGVSPEGGPGLFSTITDTSVGRAGGSGFPGVTTYGAGRQNISQAVSNGVANTGSGGAPWDGTYNSGSGGSGVVIIRYAKV